MYDGTAQHASCAYKFTGKERGSESGLDNFGVRFDASSMGRFMSPDPCGLFQSGDSRSLKGSATRLWRSVEHG
jgi:RHS repeat-associated protein